MKDGSNRNNITKVYIKCHDRFTKSLSNHHGESQSLSGPLQNEHFSSRRFQIWLILLNLQQNNDLEMWPFGVRAAELPLKLSKIASIFLDRFSLALSIISSLFSAFSKWPWIAFSECSIWAVRFSSLHEAKIMRNGSLLLESYCASFATSRSPVPVVVSICNMHRMYHNPGTNFTKISKSLVIMLNIHNKRNCSFVSRLPTKDCFYHLKGLMIPSSITLCPVLQPWWTCA